MNQFVYRFRTFASFLEETVGLKTSRSGKVSGIVLDPSLRQHFGQGVRRHYPYGTLVVLPIEIPPLPVNELVDDWDWEPEPDLILHPW